jgi:hypothetical protein
MHIISSSKTHSLGSYPANEYTDTYIRMHLARVRKHSYNNTAVYPGFHVKQSASECGNQVRFTTSPILISRQVSSAQALLPPITILGLPICKDTCHIKLRARMAASERLVGTLRLSTPSCFMHICSSAGAQHVCMLRKGIQSSRSTRANNH